MPHRFRTLWGQEDEFAWRRWPLLKGRQVTVSNSLGQKLRVRLDSLGDFYAAFGRKAERGIPRILKALPAGGVVLDVGAHIGGFSLIAAQAVGPRGRVFAFEPVSSNKDLLEHNAMINGINWMTAIEAAVGRNNSSIKLLVSDVDTMWASTRPAWTEVLHHGVASGYITARQVPVVTVDHFLREHAIATVALMKIDVEGAEMDVLAGAADSLATGRVQQLIIEVHGPTVKWKDVAAILRRYGYEVQNIGGAEMHAVLRAQGRQRGNPRRKVNKPVTVALIGCGAVSELLYARALDVVAGEGLTETVALVDPDPSRTSRIVKTLSPALQYPDLDTMLAEVTPQLGIIATPHRYHANLAITCLERGIHVLCEKPMATTTTDCDRMIESAEKAGCVLAVGHFRRFFPSCRIIKGVIQAGLLGPVRSFRFLEGETYSWPAHSASFLKRADAGGGVLIDAGAHTIDLLLWWLGDIEEVFYEDDAMGGVEANCRMRLRMASGAQGIVQLSRDWPLPNRYVIECEHGWIMYMCDVVDRIELGLYDPDFGLDAQIRKVGAKTQNGLCGLGAEVPAFKDCFVAQLRNVIAAIKGTESLQVSGVDGRSTITLIERCYQNRKLLDMPWLDDAELRSTKELANAL